MHRDEHDELDADDDIPRPAFQNGASFTHAPAWHEPQPGLRCPRCQAQHIVRRHRARRIGAALGTLAGAIGGACRTVGASEVGYAVGALTLGPPGAVLGAASAAVVSAMIGGATGRTLGAKLGAALDASLLKDYRCLSCKHTFSQPSR